MMSALPRLEALPLPLTPAPALPRRLDEIAQGRLFYRGLDVLALTERPVFANGRLTRPATPLYVRRLSALRGITPT